MKELLTTAPPFIHAMIASAEEVDAFQQSLLSRKTLKNATVRKLRGRCMKNSAACFNEFAAALQFPSYFGSNWDALDECLSDAKVWVSGTVILIFSDAESVFSEEKKRRETLLQILQSACEQSAEAKRAFHAIFACKDEAGLNSFREECEKIGVRTMPLS